MAFDRLIKPPENLLRQPLFHITFKIMISHDFIKDFLVCIHPVYECLRKHIFKSILNVFDRVILRTKFQIIIFIQGLLQLFKVEFISIGEVCIIFCV